MWLDDLRWDKDWPKDCRVHEGHGLADSGAQDEMRVAPEQPAWDDGERKQVAAMKLVGGGGERELGELSSTT